MRRAAHRRRKWTDHWRWVAIMAISLMLSIEVGDTAAQDSGLTSLPRGAVGSYGTVRYGGTLIQSAGRSLPSEARANRLSAGMLPSETRNLSFISGGRLFESTSARVYQTAAGSMRYPGSSLPTGMHKGAAPKNYFATPQLQMKALTRPLPGAQIPATGSVRYGTTAFSAPKRSPKTVPYWQKVVNRAHGSRTTRATSAKYGSVRYGGR